MEWRCANIARLFPFSLITARLGKVYTGVLGRDIPGNLLWQGDLLSEDVLSSDQ
jgi:hypothetical protein